MVDGVAIQHWIHRSSSYFTDLSKALVLDGGQGSSSSTIEGAETISRTLHSLQEWMIHNPCPDWELGDRILLLAARYGYVILVGAPDSEDLQSASMALTLKELNCDLATLLSEVEQLGTDLGAHSGDS